MCIIRLVYGLMSPLLGTIGARSIVQFHIDPTEEEVLWALKRPPMAVATCSRHIATLIRDVNARAGREIPVFPIQNAIDLDRYTPGDRAAARRRVGAQSDRPLLLMLANLAEHKGQMTAVHAVRQLKDRGLTVDCWLAGEERGSERRFTATLQRLIRDLGVEDQVTFLGFRQDGPALLQAADVFLLPSTHEGLPLSILEAQASGTVVLGSPDSRHSRSRRRRRLGISRRSVGPCRAMRPAFTRCSPTRPSIVEWLEAALEHVRREHSWNVYVERVWRDVSRGGVERNAVTSGRQRPPPETRRDARGQARSRSIQSCSMLHSLGPHHCLTDNRCQASRRTMAGSSSREPSSATLRIQRRRPRSNVPLAVQNASSDRARRNVRSKRAASWQPPLTLLQCALEGVASLSQVFARARHVSHLHVLPVHALVRLRRVDRRHIGPGGDPQPHLEIAAMW